MWCISRGYQRMVEKKTTLHFMVGGQKVEELNIEELRGKNRGDKKTKVLEGFENLWCIGVHCCLRVFPAARHLQHKALCCGGSFTAKENFSCNESLGAVGSLLKGTLSCRWSSDVRGAVLTTIQPAIQISSCKS